MRDSNQAPVQEAVDWIEYVHLHESEETGTEDLKGEVSTGIRCIC